MPQVDLETLVSACAGGSCSDRKIACETLDRDRNHPGDEDSDEDRREVPADFPPESFWLAKEAELDWLDRNAFLERKDSAKGSNSTNLNPNLNPSQSSQRFSINFKSKASILGLPKLQGSCFVDSKSRRSCKPGNARLFPRRSGSGRKSEAPAAEPSSPKVSCMGRVRSKKDRNRNRQLRSKPEPESESTWFFAAFRAIFLCSDHKPAARESDALGGGEGPILDAHDIRNRLPASEVDAPPRRSVAEPPGLGGVRRFSSGRRSGSWGVGEVDGDVAKPDSLDRDAELRR